MISDFLISIPVDEEGERYKTCIRLLGSRAYEFLVGENFFDISLIKKYKNEVIWETQKEIFTTNK